jgi:flagellar biosynthesis protein FliR
MLTIPASHIEPWLATVVLPWSRVLGWIMADPIWGHRSISRRIKIVLSAAMTWAILPAIPHASTPPEWIAALAQQLLIGISLGFAVRIIFGAVNLGGQLISTQMGLGFATLFDTNNAQSSPVIGEWITWIILALLWSTNSPVSVWLVLVHSFEQIPITSTLSAKGIPSLLGLGNLLFYWGAILALPIIIQLLFLNLSFGMLNRLAPQLNLLSLSFPVTLIAGIIMLWLAEPLWQEFTPHWIQMLLDTLNQSLTRWKN